MFSVISEEKHTEEEVVHIKSALKTYGCPQWSIDKVKDLVRKKGTNTEKCKKNIKKEKTDPKVVW